MRVLSIDWDYFVEEDPMEDPMLDFGHAEQGLFLTHMWNFRRREGTDLKTLFPFRGDESKFWLPCLTGPYRIVNAESHLSILKVIGKEKNLEIVNVDAHHDIFYNGGPPKKQGRIREPNCGSWGSHLIVDGQVSSWVQVYPEWRKKFPEDYSEPLAWMLQKKVRTEFTFSFPQTSNPVDVVFVCRSGCWVPPEYDHRFTMFCNRLGSTAFLKEREIEEIKEADVEEQKLKNDPIGV